MKYSPASPLPSLIETLSFIVIILGVPAFFIEQYQARQHAAKEATLEYVNRFHRAELTESRFLLLKPWLDQNIQKLVEAGASRETINDIVQAEIDTSADNGPNKDLRVAVFRMVDFYDSLLVCLENEICSEDLVRSYFGDYAVRFDCLYGGYIKKVKSEQAVDRFGEKLAQFAQSVKPTCGSN